MSHVAIKFMAPAALAHHLRQAALAKGTWVADIARRACEEYIGTPKPTFADALVESYHSDQGKKVVGALLSPPLASAIARLAAETRSSQSHVLRGLIREALRARELLAARRCCRSRRTVADRLIRHTIKTNSPTRPNRHAVLDCLV